MRFIDRIVFIQGLFEDLDGRNASSYQIQKVNEFMRKWPPLIEDLEFCFDVLNGLHKVGYTLERLPKDEILVDFDYTQLLVSEITIEDYYKAWFVTDDLSFNYLHHIALTVPPTIRGFFDRLVNREFRLGYTHQKHRIQDTHPMLAKSYPQNFNVPYEGHYYYVQEKLNGNRCIAKFEDNEWKFISRSQKPMKVQFDMTGLDTKHIYDGEVMRKDKMTNDDFSATTGIINSKYGDKSGLVYYIYDIIDDTMKYGDRLNLLTDKIGRTTTDVRILPVLDHLWLYPNTEYNGKLDKWLDKIVAAGGEGVMLRNPDAVYQQTRTDDLLKYKKVMTCDLRIVGYNEGQGKYAGMVGSFQCQSDCGSVFVNVAGMDDATRAMLPIEFMDRIIEVAYFATSKSKNKATISLQFPRMIGWRDDKLETSIF